MSHLTEEPTLHIDGVADAQAFVHEHYGVHFRLPAGIHALVYREMAVTFKNGHKTFCINKLKPEQQEKLFSSTYHSRQPPVVPELPKSRTFRVSEHKPLPIKLKNSLLIGVFVTQATNDSKVGVGLSIGFAQAQDGKSVDMAPIKTNNSVIHVLEASKDGGYMDHVYSAYMHPSSQTGMKTVRVTLPHVPKIADIIRQNEGVTPSNLDATVASLAGGKLVPRADDNHPGHALDGTIRDFKTQLEKSTDPDDQAAALSMQEIMLNDHPFWLIPENVYLAAEEHFRHQYAQSNEAKQYCDLTQVAVRAEPVNDDDPNWTFTATLGFLVAPLDGLEHVADAELMKAWYTAEGFNMVSMQAYEAMLKEATTTLVAQAGPSASDLAVA